MEELFNWLQQHHDVYLRMEGRYNGSPSAMKIVMEHKKHICRVSQVITDVAVDKFDKEEGPLGSVLDGMYEVLMRDVFEQERGLKR